MLIAVPIYAWVCSELWGVEKKPFELISFNHLGFVA